MRYLLIICVIGCWFPLKVQSQSKCGTVELQQMHLGQIEYREDEQRFEKWLAERMAAPNQNLSFGLKTSQQSLVTIPVVFHIIHNGEAVGNGRNIPEDQVLTQIDILNEDFRRTNPDASETPEEFLTVAADTQIQFVMAKRDPEGLPTNGIVRVQGSLSDYSLLNEELLKSESFWPSEDYLNIWVADLSNDLLGYAQFPVSNLEGLTVDRSNNRLTDGVVVDYEFLGAGFNSDPFSQGRTATHEIGHFLGLRHIWGDGGCSFDDFCSDTPQMGDNSSGCPASQVSCGSNDMYQNYMDFSDDNCMNLFTVCQANRMQAVMAESPRRLSLTTSLGGIEPVIVSNDMGIRQIVSPEVSLCSSTLTPEIEVRNYGDNNVTSFRVDFQIDGVTQESLQSNTTLQPLDIQTIIFSNIEVIQGSESTYTFSISQVNDGSDENPENDSQSLLVQVPFQGSLPLSADFENGPGEWITRQLSGEASNWTIANAPLNAPDNQAFKIDHFNTSEEEFGDLEMLLSPVLDLEKVTAAELQFQYAYAPVTGNVIDGLAVAVLTDCGVNFDPDNITPDFERYGSALATTTSKSTAFTPSGAVEWSEATINLNQFLGLQEVQLAFIAQNGGGNNIYIDNIEIFANNLFKVDIKVTEIIGLPLITCPGSLAPIVEVKNFGTETITSFDYSYTTGGSIIDGRLDRLNMEPGDAFGVPLNLSGLIEGEYRLDFGVVSVNDQSDDDPSDNFISEVFRITEQEDILPLRERFEQRSFEELPWFPFSLTGPHDWSLTAISQAGMEDQAIGINAFDLPLVGVQNWLVSPRLDLSDLTEASINFDISYANRQNFEDRLEVLVSTNCGRSFDHVIYGKSGAELAVTSSETAWTPSSENDWITEQLNLSAFAGNDDVLLAFVFTNGNGNNFYLDNLDFFTTADPPLIDFDGDPTRAYPNPATERFNITFNLDQKESVRLRMMDMMGKVMLDENLGDVLNQTVAVETASMQSGLYLVQLVGDTFKTTERVVVFR